MKDKYHKMEDKMVNIIKDLCEAGAVNNSIDEFLQGNESQLRNRKRKLINLTNVLVAVNNNRVKFQENKPIKSDFQIKNNQNHLNWVSDLDEVIHLAKDTILELQKIAGDPVASNKPEITGPKINASRDEMAEFIEDVLKKYG